MNESLKPGLSGSLSFNIPDTKTVPHLYPEAPEFRTMPHVFATGFLVGLVEWACMRIIDPHLELTTEKTVGVDINLSHAAATPPGLTVTVTAVLESISGRRLRFSVLAHDGVDEICRGTHDRYVIDTARFEATVARKRISAA